MWLSHVPVAEVRYKTRTCGFQKCPDPLAPRHLDILENRRCSRCRKWSNGKTGLLERQKQTWDDTRDVWRGRIIERIKATLEGKIAKERGKHVERTAGYSNDEEALRREFGSDPTLEESEAAGGLAARGRGQGQREPQRDQGANPRAPADAALFREPEDAPSQVEETDPEG